MSLVPNLQLSIDYHRFMPSALVLCFMFVSVVLRIITNGDY